MEIKAGTSIAVDLVNVEGVTAMEKKAGVSTAVEYRIEKPERGPITLVSTDIGSRI
jgi:hypothetical protein